MPLKNNLAHPLFSIIIPAYNVELYLAECLASVRAQTCQDFEIIIIDDGSTDATGKICEDFAKTPKITIIRQKNQGLSAARNAGVERASGEYLIFLDGDDFLEPCALEVIKNSLEPDLDLLRFQAQEVSEESITENLKTTSANATAAEKITSATETSIVKFPEPAFSATTGVEAFRNLAKMHFVENAWAYAYRRQFFQQNNFQFAKNRLSEDLGLTPLVIARAAKVKAISDICYDYRQRPGSIMHDAAQQERRVADVEAQIAELWPQIAQIPHSAPILNFLAMSLMTNAMRLGEAYFRQTWQRAKQRGWIKFIRPTSLKSIPRAITLKFLPRIFYKIYH